MNRTFRPFFISIFSVLFLLSEVEVIKANAQILSSESPYIEVNDNITLESSKNGDVYVAGNEVSVEKEINGDFFAIGKKIAINSPINGNARLIAEQITISAPISGSVAFASETIYISSTGEIEKDAYGISNKFTLDGRVGRNLNLQFSSGFDSKIGGKVIGNVIYSGSKPQILDRSFINGKIIELNVDNANKISKERLANIISKLMHSSTMIFIGMILLSIKKDVSKKLLENYKSNLGRSIIIGVISAIATPVLIVLLLTSIFGIPIALFIAFLFVSVLYFGFLIPAFALGAKIFQSENPSVPQLIIGVLLLDILTMTPIIGSLIATFIMISTLGLTVNTLIFGAYPAIKASRKDPIETSRYE